MVEYTIAFIGIIQIILIIAMIRHFNFRVKNIDDHYNTILTIFSKSLDKQNEILEKIFKERKKK